MTYDIDLALAADKKALLEHGIFQKICGIEDVRHLMEAHVFAVWDFMSLLKRIQRELTCVDLPWTPPQHRNAARLINEIVTGEESDERPGGGHASHLELYLEAMEEVGANTAPFRHFLTDIQSGVSVDSALWQGQVPAHVAHFVTDSMRVAQHGRLEDVLAYFFYGREDIIPDMFQRLLDGWTVPAAAVPMFTYYLKRHIELDGDEHGPAARRIIAELLVAEEQRMRLGSSASLAIRSRIRLWDGVLAGLKHALPVQLAA